MGENKKINKLEQSIEAAKNASMFDLKDKAMDAIECALDVIKELEWRLKKQESKNE